MAPRKTINEPHTSAADEYVTFDTASTLTGRHRDVLHRWVKDKKIGTVRHPEDGRIRLLKVDDLARAHISEKRIGFKKFPVPLALSDGRTITISTFVPNPGKEG